MSTISLDLRQLYQDTFGYTPAAFKPNFTEVIGDQGSISGTTTSAALGSDYYAHDLLGKQYYMPVKITYNDEPTRDPVLDIDTTFSHTWYLPHPVISITSRKVIVETPLTERRGTVKELINIQDYEIVIKGFIIGKTHEFPEQEVATLRTIYEKNEALSIACPLTDIFLLRPDRKGSDKVVIKELKFLPVTGVKNVRPYELHMVSDEPFNLISVS